MMSGKEKLYFLLNRIEDARDIAPSGQPLIIDPIEDLNNNFRNTELSNLFIKLGKDEKVLKLLKAPSRVKDISDELDPYDFSDDGCWHIELLPTFDRYFLETQQEPEYQKFTGKRPTTKSETKHLQQQIQSKTLKHTRKALEKIWNILQEIDELRQISPEGEGLKFPPTPKGLDFDDLDETERRIAQERNTILERLEGEGAITGLSIPVMAEFPRLLQIGPNYLEIFEKYESEYKNSATHYQKLKTEETTQQEKPLYTVTYSEKTRIISVNDFWLAKPDFDSENEIFFSYLYKHQNERISREKIEKDTDRSIQKDFHKIVENLGFKGDLKKAFFSVSRSSIEFRNPVTKDLLKQFDIKILKLN